MDLFIFVFCVSKTVSELMTALQLLGCVCVCLSVSFPRPISLWLFFLFSLYGCLSHSLSLYLSLAQFAWFSELIAGSLCESRIDSCVKCVGLGMLLCVCVYKVGIDL